MQRGVWLLQIKKGKEEEYRRRHAAVWPALIEVAQRAGLKNHSCFQHGENVIVYAEAEDLNVTFNEILASDIKKKWDDSMTDILEETDSTHFDEVFHLD